MSDNRAPAGAQEREQKPSLRWEATQRLSAYRSAYAHWRRDGAMADELTKMEAEILDLLERAIGTPQPQPDRAALVELIGAAEVVCDSFIVYSACPEMQRLREAARALSAPTEGRTDWAKLRTMSEEEIERRAAADEDNPPLTDAELAGARQGEDHGGRVAPGSGTSEEWRPGEAEATRLHDAPAGLLQCPFCHCEWATALPPEAYSSCPLCRGSFSFNSPRVVAPQSGAESDRIVLARLPVDLPRLGDEQQAPGDPEHGRERSQPHRPEQAEQVKGRSRDE